MFDIFKEIGVIGCIGAIIGLLIISWVNPTTPEGLGLIIGVCILVSIVISTTVSKIMTKSKTKDSPTSAIEDKKTKIWLPGDD